MRLSVPAALVACVSCVAVASAAEPTPAVRLTGCRVLAERIAELSFGDRGIVTEVTVEEGDRVKAGDRLVCVFDADVRAALAAAEQEAANDIALRVARKTAEVARTEYEQVLEGNARTPGTFSALDVRRLKLTAEQTELEIEQAGHELAVAGMRVEELRGRLERTRVIAPFDGFVSRVMIEEGEGITEGDPVVVLVSPDAVRVEGFAPGRTFDRLRVGDTAVVRAESGTADGGVAADREFVGEIAFVDLVVQPVTGQIRFWVRVDEPGPGLRPGMTASVVLDAAAETAAVERLTPR
ncbi:MAG: efflux RND transporter periplasmic adaptor subunit [Planctomycetota bacterium]